MSQWLLMSTIQHPNMCSTLAQKSQWPHVKMPLMCVSTVTFSCQLSSPLHPHLLVCPLSFLSLLFLLFPISALLSSSSRIVLIIVLHTHYTCLQITIGNMRIYWGKYLKCFSSNVAFFKTANNYFAPMIHGSALPSKDSEYRLLYFPH